MLYCNLFVVLVVSLFWMLVVYVSGDDGCYVLNMFWQIFYLCGNILMLMFVNDMCINVMLMMVDSVKVVQVFLDLRIIFVKEWINQIVVLFLMDFFGWIYIGQKEFDKVGGVVDVDVLLSWYVDGEGSICCSMSVGVVVFDDVLGGVGGLFVDEVVCLCVVCVDIVQKICIVGGVGVVWMKLLVKLLFGQQFVVYFDGMNVFYCVDFFIVMWVFVNVLYSVDLWLKEIGFYMVGCVQLNVVQVNVFDNDGLMLLCVCVMKVLFDVVNMVFWIYLKVYLKGCYVVFVIGLLWCVVWFGGNVMQQVDLYGYVFVCWLLVMLNVLLMQLVNEFDSKLLFGLEFDVSQIQLLIVFVIVDLLCMCVFDSSDVSCKLMMLDELQVQKLCFVNVFVFYDYLFVIWYVQIGYKLDVVFELLL